MAKNSVSRRAQEEGFTLIEIISTLVILGTISAVVYSNTGNFATSNSVTTEAEILKYNLRFAQMKSMNSKVSDIWQITFPDSDSYTLQQYSGSSSSWSDVDLPGQTSPTHTFAANITATAAPTIRYDNWGTPVQSDRSTAEGANLTITISDGTTSRSLTVTKNTGFTYLP